VFGCSESETFGPKSVAGTYVLQGYTSDSLDLHPPPAVEYPFDYIIGNPIDSVHDQIVLNDDYTYQEMGGVWAHAGFNSEISNPINVHGTYTLHHGDAGIVLTPDAASHMTVGTGSVLFNRLEFDRYPGSWVFIKQ
jgi:hypothetical protein